MSDAFARNILNYFAAYTETRFRTGKNLLYRWSNDALTLDLSVYPEFEARVLDRVAGFHPFELEIRKGEHVIALDTLETRHALREALGPFRSSESLEHRLSEIRKRLDDAGLDLEEDELEDRSLRDALRESNLELRKAFITTLSEQQDRRVAELRKRYRFDQPPPSTFNTRILCKGQGRRSPP